jgi:hypothetical protein
MVDDYGIPRVRCSCGNPLTEPAPISTSLDDDNVSLLGRPWTTWNPTTVITINATTQVTDFTVYDIDTNITYTQPTGADVSGSSMEVGNANVILSGEGIRVRNADGSRSTFTFGDSMGDVVKALDAVSRLGGSYSSPRCAYFGDGLGLENENGIFVRWTLRPAGLGGPGEIPDPLLFETDRGLDLSATRTDIERAYPNAAPALGAADVPVLIDGGLVFSFSSYDPDQVSELMGQRERSATAC